MEARSGFRIQQEHGQAQKSQTPRQHTNVATSTDTRSSDFKLPEVRLPTISSLTGSTSTTGQGGGALRSIDQKFQVNPNNGTSSLTIPLPFTQTRGQFHPALSLSYNSGTGNGPFGIGWQVTNDSISRNTSKRIPSYGTDDIFILTGADDLVHVESGEGIPRYRDGYLIQQYRSRVENSPMRIEYWSRLGNSEDSYWRTLTAANVTKFYGRTDQSRIFDTTESGRKRIFAWLLCESYDASGNAIEYIYKEENSDRSEAATPHVEACEMNRDTEARRRARYLKAVRYGNRVPCRNIDDWSIVRHDRQKTWLFQLVFDYGEHDLDLPTLAEAHAWNLRKDPFSTYRSGFEIRQYRRCRRVLLFHHMSEELGVEDYLVASTTFTYLEHASGTLLTSAVQAGHRLDKNGRPSTESTAPCTFQYSMPLSLEELKIGKKSPTNLSMLQNVTPTSTLRWIDLNGEGSPGLLVELDRSWYYQRNTTALKEEDGNDETFRQESDDFGPSVLLKNVPNFHGLDTYSFQDLNGSGHQALVMVDKNGRLQGFYDRPAQHDGMEFQPFPRSPNIDILQNEIANIDLTGDGLTDILFTADEMGGLAWHECLGNLGYGDENRAKVQTRPPQLVSKSKSHAIYLADMSGDGLTDIVKISTRNISYWPNIGYGQFGGEVFMDNSPRFDADGEFDTTRVHLLDIDGLGTTDLVYLLPSGGLMAYMNYCGNQWSDGVFVSAFPPLYQPESVFTMDLLGKGTSCLCWVGPDGRNQDELVVFYLDFSWGTKPYLLHTFSNGIGLTSSIKYCPSTKFYLQDEREGRPWRTRLPFPVYTVQRVIQKDEIDLTTRKTTYRYHDGYYDKHEREFCGFGLVESWECEEFTFDTANPYKTPICHTKMWYHTGAPEMKHPLAHTCGEVHIKPKIPNDLTSAQERDTFRALKGTPLRTEIFGLDNSRHADVPYNVSEMSYEVVPIHKYRHDGSPGVYRVQEREILQFSYERKMEDHRVKHDLVLARNLFGDVTQSVSINYGRHGRTKEEDDVRRIQNTSNLILTNLDYTNPVISADEFYKPSVARRRQYQILGLQPSGLMSFDDIQQQDFASFDAHEFPVGDEHLALSASEKQDKTKVLINEARIYFRSKLLDRRLPLQSFEPYSVVDQTYGLVSTKAMRDDIYDQHMEQVLEHSSDSIFAASGFVDLDGNNNWWKPSSLTRFGDRQKPEMELAAARSHFFIPTAMIDPFGNTSTVEMDRYHLLPVRSIDALGNIVQTLNDYRVAKVSMVTDPNMNRTKASMDDLGDVMALARMGKVEEMLGDDITDLCPVTLQDVQSFMAKPTREIARSWLGRAGRRQIYCRERLRVPEISQSSLPSFSIELVTSKHALDGKLDTRSPRSDILLSIIYYNGRGKATQKVQLRKWENDRAEWRHSETMLMDSRDNVVKTSHAFLSNEHMYVKPNQITAHATFCFYDALGRPEGVLNPNHTWTKICRSPWTMETWDAGNTVLISDPRLDADIGYHFTCIDSAYFSPTWLQTRASGGSVQRDAAKKSERYAKNPKVTLLDCMSRPLRVSDSDGSKKRWASYSYDLLGNKTSEIDCFGRTVEKSRYDLVGQGLRTDGMDTGPRHFYFNCMGTKILSRQLLTGSSKRYVYDKLQRPLETWTCDDDTSSEILWSRIEYGDSEMNAIEKNLKSQVFRIFDQSGVRSSTCYDFKGNCVTSTQRFAQNYKQLLDWTHEVSLEDTVYETSQVRDALGRPCRSVDALGRITERRYDLQSGLVRLSSGVKLPEERDDSHAPSESSQEWSLHVKNAMYTADGKPSRVDYGNTSHTEYTYDDQTRLVNRKRTWRDDGTTLEDITYNYDCMDRVVRVHDAAQQDIYFRNHRVQPVREYTYDAFGRIMSCSGREMVDVTRGSSRSLEPLNLSGRTPGRASTDTLPADGQQLVQYVESYVYDDVDNLLQLRHEISDASVAGMTRTYHYQEPSLLEPSKMSNRLSYTQIGGIVEKYGYSACRSGRVGCVSSMPGYSKLEWDNDQRLRSSARQVVMGGSPETTWYVYDHTGKRVRKITERPSASGDGTGESYCRKLKETLYLDSSEVCLKYGGNLNRSLIQNEKQISYITAEVDSADQTPVVIFEKDLSPDGLVDEGHHLIRYSLSHGLEVDDQARVVSYEEYTAFGSSTLVACRSDVEAPSRYRFASYTRDAETGLYLCGARYYASWLGRWISPDPEGTIDGLNLYVYAGNDPVNRLDAEGTSHTGLGGQSGGISGGISWARNTYQDARMHVDKAQEAFDKWADTRTGKIMLYTLGMAANTMCPGLSAVIGTSKMVLDIVDQIATHGVADLVKMRVDDMAETLKGDLKEMVINAAKSAAKSGLSAVIGDEGVEALMDTNLIQCYDDAWAAVHELGDHLRNLGVTEDESGATILGAITQKGLDQAAEEFDNKVYEIQYIVEGAADEAVNRHVPLNKISQMEGNMMAGLSAKTGQAIDGVFNRFSNNSTGPGRGQKFSPYQVTKPGGG